MNNFFEDIKLDLVANGWDNKSIFTCIRILFLSPPIHLLIFYRIQYRIARIPFFGRTLSRVVGLLSYWFTSCDINATAVIYPGVTFPHPLGIVIGKSVVVNSGCTIYQQVTLGADSNGDYPVVEKNVCIYSGAKVIGRIVIGQGSIVGANSVVVKDVASMSVVAGVPAKLIRNL